MTIWNTRTEVCLYVLMKTFFVIPSHFGWTRLAREGHERCTRGAREVHERCTRGPQEGHERGTRGALSWAVKGSQYFLF